MTPARRNYLLLFIAAALVLAASGTALGQARRKSQPRPRRPARVSGTVQTSLTPTAALRAYYRAAINQDIDAAKKYLSAGTLNLMEEGARQAGKSLDEVMRDNAGREPVVMPGFRNERIRGAAATVDIRTQGATLTMPMVKEGGEWKIALDKMPAGMWWRVSSPPPAAEGNYSEDEKHRLFQTVGMTEDTTLIIEVARKIGIVDSSGNPKPNFQDFVNAHSKWGMENAEFVREHMTKEKARAYVMAHK